MGDGGGQASPHCDSLLPAGQVPSGFRVQLLLTFSYVMPAVVQMRGALTLQFFRIVQLPMAAVFIEASLKHLSSMIIDHKVIKNIIASDLRAC